MNATVAAPQAPIPVVAVVGVGLIGGSFAVALKAAGLAGEVLGVGRNPAALGEAARLGLIDRAATLEEAGRADLVLLAMPVGATGETLRALRPHLGERTVVTDAGSTKKDVIAAAREALGPAAARFVPGHPIAGSERSGPAAARADLYRGRTVILTPLPENDPADVELVRRAWRACGAELREMDAVQHDTVLASVSHVPHLLAFAYMAQVLAAPDADLRFELAGSGFRDFTRIAGASPAMWRDIFLANREAILEETTLVRHVLDDIESLVRGGASDLLTEVLAYVSDRRRGWQADKEGGKEQA